MSRKPTRTAAKVKAPPAVETSDSIAEQTRRFLEKGNKIQYIKSGVSGQPSVAVSRSARKARSASG